MAQWLKNPLCSTGDTVLIPESGRSPRRKMATLIPVLLLEKYMDWGACWATAMGPKESDMTQVTKHKAIIDQQLKNIFVWNLYELMTGHIVYAFQSTLVIFLIDVHIGHRAFP